MVEGDKSRPLPEDQILLMVPIGPLAKQPLKKIHADDVFERNSKNGKLRDVATDDLVDSLKPGARDPLTVKPDGRILMEIQVLKSLKKEIIP